MTISEYIRNYRVSNKLTMQQLADRCGISKGYISMLEGKRNPSNNYKEITPSLATIRKLAVGMGVDVDELLSVVDDEITIAEKDQIETPYDRLKRELGIINFTDDEKKEIINYIKYIISLRNK